MRKSYLVGLAALFLVMSCGPGAPYLASPVDGQTFDLTTFTQLQVVLADNDYRDTVMQFRGLENLGGEISCQAAQNSSGLCVKNPNQGFYAQGCDAQRPCSITILVYRGGYTAVSTIVFRRGTLAPPAPVAAE